MVNSFSQPTGNDPPRTYEINNADVFDDTEKLSLDVDQTSLEKVEENITGCKMEKIDLENAVDSNVPESNQGAKDVFGNVDGDGVQFVTMSWPHTGLIMIAETISLGILSLPNVLAEIGMVPGVILILGLSIIATYTGVVLGQFKYRYPQVHNMADAGEILFGRWGREIFNIGQFLFLLFVMGSHVLTFSIMMNVTTNHGACTIIFMVIGAIISFIFTMPRRLHNMSWLSLASFISVIAAVVVVMGDVGARNDPLGKVEATRKTSIYRAFTGVTNIAFAYAGHLTFFTFMSEMKNPKDYYKSLAFLQISDTVLYIISAVVIYKYVGYGVESPALTSASDKYAKIAYGIATPTIIISGVINAHVAAKTIFVRKYRESGRMQENSWRMRGFWLALVGILWFFAWIIAESIPVFSNLLGLIAALFVSWFTFGINGMFWFHLHRDDMFKGTKNKIFAVINAFIILIGIAVTGLGLYSSIYGLTKDAGGKVFSCANNAARNSH